MFLFVEYFDLCRLEGSHGTAAAALLAPPAFPAVLAEVFATAILAIAAPPPVFADAACRHHRSPCDLAAGHPKKRTAEQAA